MGDAGRGPKIQTLVFDVFRLFRGSGRVKISKQSRNKLNAIFRNPVSGGGGFGKVGFWQGVFMNIWVLGNAMNPKLLQTLLFCMFFKIAEKAKDLLKHEIQKNCIFGVLVFRGGCLYLRLTDWRTGPFLNQIVL